MNELDFSKVQWDTERGQRGLSTAAVTVSKAGAKHPKIIINSKGINLLLGTLQKAHIVLGAFDKKVVVKICSAEEPGSIFIKKGEKFQKDAKFIAKTLQLKKTSQAPLQTIHRDMYYADYGTTE
jgi:hypothetical protein